MESKHQPKRQNRRRKSAARDARDARKEGPALIGALKGTVHIIGEEGPTGEVWDAMQPGPLIYVERKTK
jgi:hypothetical protein